MVSKNHISNLQRSLADRTIFQSSQAATQSKELCGHLQECSAVSIMDSFDSLSATLLFKVHVKVLLVLIYPVFDSTDQPIFEKKSMGLAQ